jgi:hypothetical protein
MNLLTKESPKSLGLRLYANCVRGENRRIETSCRAGEAANKVPNFGWNESVWFDAFCQWLTVAHNLTTHEARAVALDSRNANSNLEIVGDINKQAYCLSGKYVTEIKDGLVYWKWA